MNFVDAINTHVALKVHIQHYLQGISDPEFDAEAAGMDNACVLGHWLYDQLTVWQDLPVYWAALQDHTAFHRCIETILELHKAGDSAAAEQLLQHEYVTLSHKLVHSLLELSHSIGDSPVAPD